MTSDDINHGLNRSALYIALMVAWVAMLGSLYFSEVKGYVPCPLCWYQRILMYPLAGLIAFGLLRLDTNLPYLVLPFSILGMCVSTYHYLLEKTELFDATAALYDRRSLHHGMDQLVRIHHHSIPSLDRLLPHHSLLVR